MKLHKSVTQSRIVAAATASMVGLDNPGICVLCGADADGCEPDARRYECEVCGERGVYGAEELLFATGAAGV